MDFEQIQQKEPTHIIPLYREQLIRVESSGFMDHYHELIFERDFLALFKYHVDLFKNKTYTRIQKADKNFPKKTFSLQHLCQEILIENVEQKDIGTNLKYHLYAFSRSYDLVASKIEDRAKSIPEAQYFSDELITTNTKILKRLMWDVEEILPYFESAFGLEISGQVTLSRNISGEDISWFTQLFLNGILDYSNQAYFTTIAFLIRQRIEIRIKNALGIYSIELNGIPLKITADIFVDFILKNAHVQMPSFDKGIIRSIFKWCNAHIHIGVTLFSWQTLVINEYILPLFQTGRNENQWSIHGSISIEKAYYLDELSSDIIKYLKEKGIQADSVKLRDRPEAILI